MDTYVDRLRHRLIQSFQSGPLVQFNCTPPSAKLNEKVKIAAVILPLPNKPLNAVEPCVRCVEKEDFEVYLSRVPDKGDDELYFENELKAEDLGAGRFTLTLSIKAEQAPVASTILHIFEKSEIDNFMQWFSR